jgi:uncharacterized protein (TIGR02996 family)
MNPLDALYAALDQDPTDALARVALADWYEEQGDTLAAQACRWILEKGKRPYDYGDGRGWRWWCRHLGGRMDYDDLPEPLFRMIPQTPSNDLPDQKRVFPSRRAAEEALIAAFRMAARAGWEPEEQG